MNGTVLKDGERARRGETVAASEKTRRDPRKRPVPVISRAAPKADADKSDRSVKKGKKGKPTDEDAGPKFVGGARNEHGTRVARRVTCSRCQAVDHVAYSPRDPTRALCRSCAKEVLEIYEQGMRVRVATRPTKCNLCGAPFNIPLSAEDDGDPLCKSCLQGFTSWQGSVDRPFEERQQTVLEPRASGTVVRKIKKPS
jgi:formylmethanofuran dehydrogenase subunit E